MRRSIVLFSASMLAAFHGVSNAQTYSTAPRSSAVSYPSPYAPGCATPGVPSTLPSIGSGGVGIGSMPGSGSTPSGTPGSGAGMGAGAGADAGAGMGAGAGAAGAGAAAAGASAAASSGESGSGSLASAAPQMIGDLLGYGRAGHLRGASGNPLASRGPFKIAENESPRPTDRVFATFNYFNGANNGINHYDVYRGVLGFEKTFLDGNASFGLRAPMQQDSSGGAGIDGFGDLSLIGKYAFINDTETGTVASAGVVLTVPTGRSIVLSDGHKLDAVLIQPWIGGILVEGDAYAHGFSSIVASTDSRDPTLFTLDLGVGYRIYQSQDADSILTSITPTVEGHLTTAFQNKTGTGDVYFGDQLIITGGVHLGLFNKAYFTIGGAIPLTGGRLNDFEAIAQFNYRF